MPDKKIMVNKMIRLTGFVMLLMALLSSCGKPFVSKAPKDKYYHYQNNIEIKQGNFTKAEKTALLERLNGQLDDSSRIRTKRRWVFINTLKKPLVYDSNYTVSSAKSMVASLFHLGYYHASILHNTDSNGKKITVNYFVYPGKQTLIDTVNYKLRKPDLQQLALQWMPQSALIKNQPITKTAVLTEINRLVDSFRNNGYYKFTSAELRVRGDTTIEALTFVSDDPFEQLRILAESQQKKDSPRIRLQVVLNTTNDSSRLEKYFIRRIYILPDFRQGDNFKDTANITIERTRSFIIQYHDQLYKNRLYARNITFRPGQLFKQVEYYKTLNNLSKTGVWQSVNIQVEEVIDTPNLVDLIVEMIPSRKFGFETALEVSYSAASNTSNVLAGNLFGLSGNISLLNRNLAKEAIRMTHNIRAGVELNSNNRGSGGKLINSNELSYGNTTSFPRLLLPKIPNFFSSNRQTASSRGETFINLGLAYNNRLNLFNLQSVNAGFGWSATNKKGWKWTWTGLNIGFSYLFNESDSFKTILKENPFLQFSYNTAFVTGMAIGFSKNIPNLKHPHSLLRELGTRFNLEESGLTWGLLPVLNKYKRRYIKADAELKYSISYPKTVLAFRGFLGVGVPLLGIDTNRTLPFFKQYFSGGSNSMRAWPVRGLGPGGRALVPFSSTKTIFNDRTGDMQLELNAEYRYTIARIIPNTLTLKGALFADIGNIWNLRSTKSEGLTDSAQFKFKNLYSQLGVSAGTGLRLDFSYFILRLDFGFRFKRPELFYDNNGWKAPKIGFDDLFQKLFTRGKDDEYRRWRYENFNFTIGIGYSF